MAALLVGLSVAAVLMTAAMPVWKQLARREREAELVFRGQQYARAIGLFQKRAGPGVLPQSLDVLVSGHFLRKRFKDPITNDDFDLLTPTVAAGAGGAGGNAVAGGGAAGGRGFSAPAAQTGGRGASPVSGNGAVVAAQPTAGGGVVAGIIGVASKSKDESLRAYNGRTHYNEWQFIFVPQTTPTQPGQEAAGGGRGGPSRGGTPPTGLPGGIGGGAQGGRGPGRGGAPLPPPPSGGRGSAPSPLQGQGSPFAPRR